MKRSQRLINLSLNDSDDSFFVSTTKRKPTSKLSSPRTKKSRREINGKSSKSDVSEGAQPELAVSQTKPLSANNEDIELFQRSSDSDSQFIPETEVYDRNPNYNKITNSARCSKRRTISAGINNGLPLIPPVSNDTSIPAVDSGASDNLPKTVQLVSRKETFAADKFECPLCSKRFDSNTAHISHVKQCAKKKKISAMDLMASMAVETFGVKPSGPSISLFTEPMALDRTAESTLEKFGFTSKCPALPSVTVARRQKFKQKFPVLKTRSSEDRLKLVTEKAAVVLLDENSPSVPNCPGQPEEREASKLWELGSNESGRDWYITNLNKFISPQKLEKEIYEKEKSLSGTARESLQSQSQDDIEFQTWMNSYGDNCVKDGEVHLSEVLDKIKCAPCTLSEDWSRMVNNPDTSDLSLLTMDGTIYLHTLVLRTRCPTFFAAEYEQVFSENPTELLLCFLYYVYTGKFKKAKTSHIEPLLNVSNIFGNSSLTETLLSVKEFLKHSNDNKSNALPSDAESDTVPLRPSQLCDGMADAAADSCPILSKKYEASLSLFPNIPISFEENDSENKPGTLIESDTEPIISHLDANEADTVAVGVSPTQPSNQTADTSFSLRYAISTADNTPHTTDQYDDDDEIPSSISPIRQDKSDRTFLDETKVVDTEGLDEIFLIPDTEVVDLTEFQEDRCQDAIERMQELEKIRSFIDHQESLNRSLVEDIEKQELKESQTEREKIMNLSKRSCSIERDLFDDDDEVEVVDQEAKKAAEVITVSSDSNSDFGNSTEEDVDLIQKADVSCDIPYYSPRGYDDFDYYYSPPEINYDTAVSQSLVPALASPRTPRKVHVDSTAHEVSKVDTPVTSNGPRISSTSTPSLIPLLPSLAINVTPVIEKATNHSKTLVRHLTAEKPSNAITKRRVSATQMLGMKIVKRSVKKLHEANKKRKSLQLDDQQTAGDTNSLLTTSVLLDLDCSWNNDPQTSVQRTPRLSGQRYLEVTPRVTPSVTLSDKVTPYPNFSVMKSASLKKHLQKYGLKKSLGKTKAKKVLKHIYDELHPIINKDTGKVIQFLPETNADKGNSKKKAGGRKASRKQMPQSKTSEGASCISPLKDSVESLNSSTPKKKQNETLSPFKVSTEPTVSPAKSCAESTHSSFATSFSSNLSDNDGLGEFSELEDEVLSQVHTQKMAVDEACRRYIQGNQDLYRRVLRYEPIWVEELRRQVLDTYSAKYKLTDIIDYLDKQCITFRSEAQAKNNQRRNDRRKTRKASKKSSPKKTTPRKKS